MNRRDFFKVTFATGVAAAVPAILAERLPEIVGDGVHDDTAGLQAALNGRDFIAHNGCVRVEGGMCYLNGGLYRLTKTLEVGENKPFSMANASFRSSAEMFMRVQSNSPCQLIGVSWAPSHPSHTLTG